jgi:hypothetical protein
MLEATITRGKRELAFYTELRSTQNVPAAFCFWLAEEARRLLQIAAYFRAAAIMCQIPGGARYNLILYDDDDPKVPNEDQDPAKWIRGTDRQTVLTVLAECLRRLGVPAIMNQVPGVRSHRPRRLSKRWTAYLDRHARIKSGLLNVVAECLDELMVRPGLAKIESLPATTCWQRWCSQIE